MRSNFPYGTRSGVRSNVRASITAGPPADTTPDQFTFTDVVGAAQSTQYTSNAVPITGIDSTAPISITGGTYSINGGAFTSSPGTVAVGQTVAVRLTSAAAANTAANATLNVGGVTDTYTVTTDLASYTFTNTEASNYVTAMSVQPTNVRKQIIDNFVTRLKTGTVNGTNVYSSLGMMLLLKSHDEQASRINLIDPTNIGAVTTGTTALTFTTDVGYMGGGAGSGSYINMNKTHATYLTNAGGGQNSCSHGVHFVAQGTRSSTNNAMGAIATGTISIGAVNGNAVSGRCGSSTVTTAATQAAASGHKYVLNRTVSTSVDGWEDATKTTSAAASTSSAPDATNNVSIFRILTSYGNPTLSVAWIGAGLTDNQIADLNAAINYFNGAF